MSHITLTPRQVEIVRLSASGITYKAIAKQLRVTFRTVEAHHRQIYMKLGVTGLKNKAREKMIAWARAEGLL